MTAQPCSIVQYANTKAHQSKHTTSTNQLTSNTMNGLTQLPATGLLFYPTHDESETQPLHIYVAENKSVNHCEQSDDGNCSIQHGVYFGSDDYRSPVYCAHHAFAENTGTSYKFDDDTCTECKYHVTRCKCINQ